MIKNLLENIKFIINRLFGKSKLMLQGAGVQKDELVEESENKIEEEFLLDNEFDLDKQEFFELYKKIKKGTTSIDSLMINDLIKLQLMFQEQDLMYEKKIEKEEEECKILDFEIARLYKENEKIRMLG